METVIKRLARVEGQVRAVKEKVMSDTTCHEILPQLLAVKGALDACIETYIHESLAQCEDLAKEDMQSLIKILLRKL